MFNGIVETLGTISSLERTDAGLKLFVQPNVEFQKSRVGDSIAVNGVCLTVTQFKGQGFYVDVVPETLRVTNLTALCVGNQVNLETPVQFNHLINGHLVQGHIDAVGEIIDLMLDGTEALIAKISIPHALHKYIINKGCIALDGMSITVKEVRRQWFTVTFIPYTRDHTIVKDYRIGSKINIEVDQVSKYIEKLLASYYVTTTH